MSITEKFEQFHADHPDVYDQLVELARRMRSRGHAHYGIATLFEVVRYHRHTSGKDADGFKLNNNYRSHYARLIMERERDLNGMFHLRELKAA
jgi:hypothetical protein